MLLRGAGGPAGGLLGEGGGGGAPGLLGAGKPSKVFWRVAEGGETGPRLVGRGAGAAPLGRDFFAASPSNTSRSELALSLIDAALSAFYSDPALAAGLGKTRRVVFALVMQRTATARGPNLDLKRSRSGNFVA